MIIRRKEGRNNDEIVELLHVISYEKGGGDLLVVISGELLWLSLVSMKICKLPPKLSSICSIS